MLVMRCALVIALAGCSRVLGFNDVTLGDGGTDAGSDGGPLVAPPNTVVGRIYTRCLQPSGDVDAPTDLSQSIIQALVPDGSARGYRTVEGVGKADGTFKIEDVPDGITYMFRLGTVYSVTDERVLDDAFVRLRRCEPAPNLATTATPVAWDLTGMTPVRVGLDVSDHVEIVSFALPYHSFVSELNAGDTAFRSMHDWGTRNPTVGPSPLIDASAGDDLYVFHSRREPLPDPVHKRRRSVAHVVDWARPTGITLQNGVSTSITGVFQPIPANKSISFSADRALFDAGYDGMSHVFDFNVRILAAPVLDDSLGGEVLASFELNDISRSTDLRHTVTSYAYADPFPDSWKRYSVVEYTLLRSFAAATFNSSMIVFSRQVAEYTTTINTTPVLRPVSGATIGGVDFELGGRVAFDGIAPVEVTWNPVLSAKSYRLSVSRVAATGRQSIAAIRTTGTSLKLPAALFDRGEFYVFALSAIRTPNDYQAGHLAASGLPWQVADLPSGVFRFSSDCGDGVVKSGEESCDARGETAACDVDCTMPECGDGLRNAAAGEACDAGGVSTPGCDHDCTLPVCGDGDRNFALEDCDDGDTVDDFNGCSRECKFNNFCGDGHVSSVVEECDPGLGPETATCDSDCTRPVCGDEHVNAAAGEECDDGPANGTGRCSTACKLQP
jgi:hypothetical protein